MFVKYIYSIDVYNTPKFCQKVKSIFLFGLSRNGFTSKVNNLELNFR